MNKYNIGDVIFIWNDIKTPYGRLDYEGRKYYNQRLQAPSSYRVIGVTTDGKKIQVRKLDEVGDRLLDNEHYTYFINSNDVEVL